MTSKAILVAAAGLGVAAMLIPAQTLAAPPDHAGGKPASIIQCMEITEPGSYALGNNLTYQDTSTDPACITVSADYVTIDLNGFVIDGGYNDAAGIGEGPGGVVGTEIRNGAIIRFTTGINMPYSGFTTVRDMRVIWDTHVASTYPNGIETGPSSTIADNTVFAVNGNDGIRTSGGSIVSGNTISGFGFNVGLFVGKNSLVTGNVAWNSGVGMSIQCPSNVVGNTSADNTLGDLEQPLGTNCEYNSNLPVAPNYP